MKTISLFVIAALFMLACEKTEFEQDQISTDTTTTNVDTSQTSDDVINIFMPVPSIYGYGISKSTTDSVLYIEEQSFAPLPDSLDDQLVLYYPFDEGLKNESQTQVFAMLSDGEFNQTNNYITIENDDVLNFDSTFTIAVWFNNNGAMSNLAQNIVSKWRRVWDDFNNIGYALEYMHNEDGVIMIEFHNVFDVAENTRASYSCQYFGNELTQGWHFIVVTYDRDIKMWIDNNLVCNSEWGILTGSGRTGVYYSGEYTSYNDYGGKLVNNQEPIYICGENSEYWLEHYFYGAIDNIMLFNRSLSDEEVNVLYELRQ